MPISAKPLIELCESGIADGAFPGAAFVVGDADESTFGFAGRHTYAPEAPEIGSESLFDMASVTKVMATTPAAMLLHDDGKLPLDDPVSTYLPAFSGGDKDNVKVRNLLLHDSGLPAYATLTKYPTPQEARAAVLALPLRAKPGEKTEYSCMSMITLMQVVEAIAGEPMDAFLKRRLWGPLGMSETMFNPSDAVKARCVPTEEDKSLRNRLIQGEVHDPAAWACGGTSGNAGLFSSIRDVDRYLRLMLDKGVFGGQQILCSNTIESWTKRAESKSTRGLGWDTKSRRGSSAGSKFSMHSYGHTGFTGTSVWIDPENRLYAALLTNRVYPTADNSKITAFRPKFHDLAFDLIKIA